MIERKPLRADVQKEILARLADRRLAPGSRVSRTLYQPSNSRKLSTRTGSPASVPPA